MHMKILKRLFVGCLVLLLSAIPVLVSAGVNENTHPSTLNVSVYNSLGTLQITHIPLYWNYIKYHGMVCEFFPPEDNPGYDYYFCEVDGVVLMNFSLTVEHRLNPVSPFFADRYTWINDLWISGGGVDYRVESKERCGDENFTRYCINITDVPLETNGENVTLTCWLSVMPAVTSSGEIHNLMELLPSIEVSFNFDILIYPIQC